MILIGFWSLMLRTPSSFFVLTGLFVNTGVLRQAIKSPKAAKIKPGFRTPNQSEHRTRFCEGLPPNLKEELITSRGEIFGHAFWKNIPLYGWSYVWMDKLRTTHYHSFVFHFLRTTSFLFCWKKAVDPQPFFQNHVFSLLLCFFASWVWN